MAICPTLVSPHNIYSASMPCFSPLETSRTWLDKYLCLSFCCFKVLENGYCVHTPWHKWRPEDSSVHSALFSVLLWVPGTESQQAPPCWAISLPLPHFNINLDFFLLQFLSCFCSLDDSLWGLAVSFTCFPSVSLFICEVTFSFWFLSFLKFCYPISEF